MLEAEGLPIERGSRAFYQGGGNPPLGEGPDAGAYGPGRILWRAPQEKPCQRSPGRPYRKPTQVGGSSRPRRVSEPSLRNSAN